MSGRGRIFPSVLLRGDGCSSGPRGVVGSELSGAIGHTFLLLNKTLKIAVLLVYLAVMISFRVTIWVTRLSMRAFVAV